MFRAKYFMMVWQVGDGPCRKIYTWNDQYVPLSVEPGERKIRNQSFERRMYLSFTH
jgi:hypothetical protein